VLIRETPVQGVDQEVQSRSTARGASPIWANGRLRSRSRPPATSAGRPNREIYDLHIRVSVEP